MRRRAAIAVLFLCAASSPARPQGGSAAVPSQEEVELTADRIRRLPSGALVAESGTMTPGDCAAEPDFELDSSEVKIEDDRARLSSPHRGLLGASIPLLLPLSLPLTERQTGLLFPPFQYSAISGFGTDVPLLLPLGRSYDATVAAGLFTGSGGH